MSIRTKSYPRAAVIGNPSDGYFGKTIAFVFSNFCTEVELNESERIIIQSKLEGTSEFEDLAALRKETETNGYRNKNRLVIASIKRLLDYCTHNKILISNQNFSIQYQSNIPFTVGMAGSSAIITAVIKALMEFYSIKIPSPLLANLILEVETKELGISAGLQDRVAQVYEQPVFMDFREKLMIDQHFGFYETFSANLLPNLYIAYRSNLAEGSEVVHNDLRERFEKEEQEVVMAMEQFAELTTQAYECLLSRQNHILGALMNQNFDLRRSICDISSGNQELIAIARNCGASAKFTGSGGAIIGTYADDNMYEDLQTRFAEADVQILKPDIVSSS